MGSCNDIISHHLLVSPSRFTNGNGGWTRELPATEKLRVQQDLSLYQTLEELIKETEAELGRLSTCDPWVKDVPFLVQLPGLGVLSAMRLLAAMGEISRFPSAKHLVGYSGLGASVHQSGETNHGGSVTGSRTQ